MTKFLNRLLGAHVDMQSKIFSMFCSLLVRLFSLEQSGLPLCFCSIRWLATLTQCFSLDTRVWKPSK